MDYTRVSFSVDEALSEPLIAWLGEAGFTMFEETAEGVHAYIPANEFNETEMVDAVSSIPALKNIPYVITFLKDENWNKEWESNFEPVLIAGRVFIRAPFHKNGDEFQYQITIEPKMSFGTGHHATTALMMELMLQFDQKNKTVLDMGCGTGVLGILSSILGAKSILAVDIDDWAYENSIENAERNNCKNITVKKGDMSVAANRQFDVVLANINRNVLLSDMHNYFSAINDNGELYVSGILLSDKEIISASAVEAGFTYITEASRNNWLAMLFRKNKKEQL